jgi:hypothetical protein
MAATDVPEESFCLFRMQAETEALCARKWRNGSSAGEDRAVAAKFQRIRCVAIIKMFQLFESRDRKFSMDQNRFQRIFPTPRDYRDPMQGEDDRHERKG